MSRHPFSRYWIGRVLFAVAAVLTFVAALWSASYVAAIGTLLTAALGYAVYLTGESSDLPGTSGRNDKNVPT